ncbi:membrane protein [Dulcicalothrix desertica PCC 7102]|uniref:Membrane protein n=1 Tax=Dulcicalothrix desertica PCC 7102 TaxID=232991 RepID=A0A3S1AIH1_9CYAN|nr:DUF924 family protein [Dulcicalothrix desertica]RUT01566.1 membrane protein [Dulcicalothrix desertica PCC 7102]
MSQVDNILDFWFGKKDEEDYEKGRAIWFTKYPDINFDREIQVRFMEDYNKAAAGKLDQWKETPHGCLALILLLDQFPRNMFRGNPQAFATDPQALFLAQYAISKGFDRELLKIQRWFIYLPFEHSENLEHQRQAVELFRQLGNDPDSVYMTSSAVQHLEVIECFGRFPHRNAIFCRATTPEEAKFLEGPNSSF